MSSAKIRKQHSCAMVTYKIPSQIFSILQREAYPVLLKLCYMSYIKQMGWYIPKTIALHFVKLMGGFQFRYNRFNGVEKFVTLIETMGSVVFTWEPFEVELAARPITILSPCFALDKVKSTLLPVNIKMKFNSFFKILNSPFDNLIDKMPFRIFRVPSAFRLSSPKLTVGEGSLFCASQSKTD